MAKMNSSSYIPDVKCFASVYHTNIDRLSTTPSRSLISHEMDDYQKFYFYIRLDVMEITFWYSAQCSEVRMNVNAPRNWLKAPTDTFAKSNLILVRTVPVFVMQSSSN